MDDNGDGDMISLSVGVGRAPGPYVVPELTGTLRPLPPLILITETIRLRINRSQRR